jgi:hypothetical protein
MHGHSQQVNQSGQSGPASAGNFTPFLGHRLKTSLPSLRDVSSLQPDPK